VCDGALATRFLAGRFPDGLNDVADGSLGGGFCGLPNEPGREPKGQQPQQPNADDHEADRDDPALRRDGVAVAVPDGGDRGAGPPQGVTECRDVRAMGVALAVQHPHGPELHGEHRRASHSAARVDEQSPGRAASHGLRPADQLQDAERTLVSCALSSLGK